jgi:hypothetical protein
MVPARVVVSPRQDFKGPGEPSAARPRWVSRLLARSAVMIAGVSGLALAGAGAGGGLAGLGCGVAFADAPRVFSGPGGGSAGQVQATAVLRPRHIQEGTQRRHARAHARAEAS